VTDAGQRVSAELLLGSKYATVGFSYTRPDGVTEEVRAGDCFRPEEINNLPKDIQSTLREVYTKAEVTAIKRLYEEVAPRLESPLRESFRSARIESSAEGLTVLYDSKT